MRAKEETSNIPLSKNQNRAIDFSMERKGSAWFMPPGMGKTRSWLETIGERQGRTLVIAPKLVCMDTWPRENRKWGFNYPMRFLHGRERHLRGKELVSLINYEAIPWLVEKVRDGRKMPWEYVIFDELSKMKNTEAKRCVEWDSIAGRFPLKSGGTGTPVGAHLKDLFGEMYAVDGGRSLGTDFTRFKREHFYECEYSRKLEAYHDAEKLILDKIAPRAIAFDINDLDMPPIKHIPHYLKLPADVREYYEAMHDDSVVEDLELYAVNAAVRSGKLRQMASGGVLDTNKTLRRLHSTKAEHLKEIMEEHDGRPVMVFFEFRSDYESICRVLGYEVPALHGRTRAKDAVKWVRQWNEGKLPVLGMHPRSAAYGLNLQDSGNVIVWYTVPWSFEMLNQGTMRLWRQGQQNKVLCYYLIVEKTVDEDVYERVEERAATHDRVMEGLL